MSPITGRGRGRGGGGPPQGARNPFGGGSPPPGKRTTAGRGGGGGGPAGGHGKRRHNKHTHNRRTRGAPAALMPGGWIGNDVLPSCVAVAVANSLLAQTGFRAPDEDVAALHRLAGGTWDAGTVVSDTLGALLDYGLCGFRPCDVTAGDPAGDVVAAAGDHAFLLCRGEAVTWGAAFPAGDLAVEEAWAIRWA
jgi:hypothetical protein